MNRQDVFDRVARHLLTQNAKSQIGDDGSCAYRATKGRRCAIGALIEDAHYSADLEYKSVSAVKVVEALIASGIEVDYYDTGADFNGTKIAGGRDVEFLRKLQRIHDDCDVATWRESLSNCASVYGLATTVLDEVKP